MPKGREGKDSGVWIVRDVPRDLMKRARVAAAVQGKPVKTIIIELMEKHLHELERKGMLPKGK